MNAVAELLHVSPTVLTVVSFFAGWAVILFLVFLLDGNRTA
jgi:hypothetical protein